MIQSRKIINIFRASSSFVNFHTQFSRFTLIEKTLATGLLTIRDFALKIAKCGHFDFSLYVENMVKRCAWGTCRNDSRFPHLQNKNKNGDPLKFFRFPAPKRWKEAAERRKRWIVACHRGDGFECKKDSYICSLHFVGENGPTSEHPDPISAITSKEKVC